MPTLILPPRYTEDTNLIRKAAIQSGWEVERLSSWRAPEELRHADPVLYGEPLFAAVVADSLGLALIEPPFNWLATLSYDWTRRKVEFASLSDARKKIKAFIKPADNKCFAARVYDSGAELPDASILSDDTPVLVSEPVKWEIEFRCFVLESKVETLSPYLRNGELAQSSDGSWDASPEESQAAHRYIESFLEIGCHIPPAVVIDIGVITGIGWAVIEANAAWGSGIYGCDPVAVLRVLQRASFPREKLTREDSRWIPKRSE